MEMKVVPKKEDPLVSISIQLRKTTLKNADKKAAEANLSRQKFIDKVLAQAMADPNFVLKAGD